MAYHEARRLYAATKLPEHLKLLKNTVAGLAVFLETTGRHVEFNTFMREADLIDPQDPAWILERACLLARGGRLSDALMRVDESGRLKVLGYGVDRALKSQSKEFLPDELHEGFDTILNAFRAYEAGKDEEARTLLEPIGLQSPFLEWKLLLRGLIAFANNEDDRAAENFSRLDRTRVPFRLCGPYYCVAAPAHRASLPPEVAAKLDACYRTLSAGQLTSSLREVAKHLGQDKPMAPMFRAIEPSLQALKGSVLFKRIANCLYHAMVKQGEPSDLDRYRKLFGPPADDPSFFRLQALIAEAVQEPRLAKQNWQKYDEWLATNPPGWPDDLRNRVRAMIWYHMGTVCNDMIEDLTGMPVAAQMMFEAMRGPKKNPKQPDGPPSIECYRRAAELAPDWEPPSREYFSELIDAKNEVEAERVARSLIEHHPEKHDPLTALASMISRQNRPADALELLMQARAVDPLNDSIIGRVVLGVIALARSHVIGGSPQDAITLLAQHEASINDFAPSIRDAVLAVASWKLGRMEEAEVFYARSLGDRGMRIAAAFYLAVDSQLAKLKPVLRKRFESEFKAALVPIPTASEAYSLLQAYDVYLDEGLTYRGQKTQEKKFLDLAIRSMESTDTEASFERLARQLFEREDYTTAKKLLTKCLKRFPKNPCFRLLLAEVGICLSERPDRVADQLGAAKRLAESSTIQAHRELLTRIDELRNELGDPFDLLSSIFGGRF